MFNLRRGRGKVRGTSGPNTNVVLTDGFSPSVIDRNTGDTLVLHYTERAQPDLGGALNYSYDLYALPLGDVTGGFTATAHSFRTVTPASGQWQQAPITAMGGNITGIFVFQPLLNPYAEGSGLDVYGD